MKTIAIIYILTFVGSQTLFAQVPVINSFSPLSGPQGTVVTITGVNFSTVPASNTVFFGAVKAPVLSASSSQLAVAVPVGATFQPLSVMVNNLTAYAAQPFVVTFPGGGYSLTPYTFYNQALYPPSNYPVSAAASDLDGDGKPDFIVANQVSNNITVYRNYGTNNAVSFNVTLSLTTGAGPGAVEIADIDGDGKPDVLSSNFNSGIASSVSVFRNTTGSTASLISFAAGLTLSTGDGTTDVKAADFDGDGKIDIVATSSGYFSVFRNTSTPGTIMFATKLDVINVWHGNNLSLTDIDKDGKIDVSVTNFSGNNISVFRNTSNGTTIAFAPAVNFPTGTNPSGIATADFNADGKPDIALVNYSSNSLTLYQNGSTPASVSFVNRIDIAIGSLPRTINIGDMDGDSKPDLVVSYGDTSGNISMFRNISLPGGALAFEMRRNYKIGNYQTYSAIADLNLDGKPDIIGTNTSPNSIIILRNRIGEIMSIPLCPPVGNETIISVQPATTYQWQIDTGNGFTNISNNANYNGANTANLQLSNIPSAWSGYRFRCLANGNYNEVYSLSFTNIWMGSVSTAWENPANWRCGTVPDANTDVIIQRGSNILISSNVSIKSLFTNPFDMLRVAAGYNLIILQ